MRFQPNRITPGSPLFSVISESADNAIGREITLAKA